MSNNALALLDQDQNLKTLTQLALINMPHGTAVEEANRLAMKEITNMRLLMDVRPELQVCAPNSILNAIKQCINDNLSLSPSAGLVYLYPTQVTIGTDGANQPIKEWVMNYDPNANGRLSIARQTGAILDHKRPYFEFDAVGALDKVHLEILLPSWGAPRWERITFDKRSFAKWRTAAEKKYNGKTPSAYKALHDGIDPEFAASKAVRHGLSRLGTNTNEKRHLSQPVERMALPAIDPEVALMEAQEHGSEVKFAYVEDGTADYSNQNIKNFEAELQEAELKKLGITVSSAPVDLSTINPNDL